jgi:hypothetical protein
MSYAEIQGSRAGRDWIASVGAEDRSATGLGPCFLNRPGSMYTTLSHLQSAIRVALQKGQLCRVYLESLVACWPNISDEMRSEKVAQFAAQYHWSVTMRHLPSLGLVAEFHAAGAPAKIESAL